MYSEKESSSFLANLIYQQEKKRNLKQMLRKEAAGELSIDKILMQFPGKSEDMILNFREEFNDKKKNQTSL